MVLFVDTPAIGIWYAIKGIKTDGNSRFAACSLYYFVDDIEKVLNEVRNEILT